MAATSKVDRVLLVGFMGSGKTTVGQLLAERMGWSFLDFDAEIEARLERPIAAVFDDEGERFFREVESEVGAELLSQERVVLASGGGWPVASGNWDTVPGGTLSVWLEVAPETVQERLARESLNRPLLAKTGIFSQARTLMSERTVAYERADCRVVTDLLTPPQVTDEIEALVSNRRNMDQNPERMSN